MAKRKAFLANPKPQDHVSQLREHDCSSCNKKNEDYYKYPRLSHSQVNVSYKENARKKSFYYKSKALISCIPIWRT